MAACSWAPMGSNAACAMAAAAAAAAAWGVPLICMASSRELTDWLRLPSSSDRLSSRWLGAPAHAAEGQQREPLAGRGGLPLHCSAGAATFNSNPLHVLATPCKGAEPLLAGWLTGRLPQGSRYSPLTMSTSLLPAA